MQRLHITNGDSAADIIRQCGIAGDVLPWRDPMHHGPFPHGFSLHELGRLRIAYLCGDATLHQLIVNEQLKSVVATEDKSFVV